MRKISYAGTWFFTGDAIAEALLEYAKALARSSASDTVFVPGRTAQGMDDQVEVLIGPASQLVSEAVESIEQEIEDPAFVERVKVLTASVEPQRFAAVPVSGGEAAIDPEFLDYA